jgi:hypothetical protein
VEKGWVKDSDERLERPKAWGASRAKRQDIRGRRPDSWSRHLQCWADWQAGSMRLRFPRSRGCQPDSMRLNFPRFLDW